MMPSQKLGVDNPHSAIDVGGVVPRACRCRYAETMPVGNADARARCTIASARARASPAASRRSGESPAFACAAIRRGRRAARRRASSSSAPAAARRGASSRAGTRRPSGRGPRRRARPPDRRAAAAAARRSGSRRRAASARRSRAPREELQHEREPRAAGGRWLLELAAPARAPARRESCASPESFVLYAHSQWRWNRYTIGRSLSTIARDLVVRPCVRSAASRSGARLVQQVVDLRLAVARVVERLLAARRS